MKDHSLRCSFFFFNDTATTEIYTLSLHDALPISNSCICHTSEKSPVTPIIATDPKMPSCKSCVCHTCDPLPPPPLHLLLPFFLPPPVTDHESRRYFFGAAAAFAPATASTPKSQTKRFMPSG